MQLFHCPPRCADGSATSAEVDGLTSEVSYIFRVEAEDAAGNLSFGGPKGAGNAFRSPLVANVTLGDDFRARMGCLDMKLVNHATLPTLSKI